MRSGVASAGADKEKNVYGLKMPDVCVSQTTATTLADEHCGYRIQRTTLAFHKVKSSSVPDELPDGFDGGVG